MDDSERRRHDKSWNDPPLFTYDQLNKGGAKPLAAKRRNYPMENQSSQPVNAGFAVNNGQQWSGMQQGPGAPYGQAPGPGMVPQGQSGAYGQMPRMTPQAPMPPGQPSYPGAPNNMPGQGFQPQYPQYPNAPLAPAPQPAGFPANPVGRPVNSGGQPGYQGGFPPNPAVQLVNQAGQWTQGPQAAPHFLPPGQGQGMPAPGQVTPGNYAPPGGYAQQPPRQGPGQPQYPSYSQY
ncbi:hypothetical protein HDE_12545 [Halotydeus destructor]|nr:hypothetical protein HDE_12545 [Halotydeus destructor]